MTNPKSLKLLTVAEQVKSNTSPEVRQRNQKWPDAVLSILLALLPCLFFWRLITPNPADRMVIASGDFTEQYFPLRAFTAGEWVQGRIPLWNPYLYGGQPALADIQSGVLYLPHVLEALLLGWGSSRLGWEIGFPLWALQWQVIAHFSLAAVGTYLFARSYFLRLHPVSSPASRRLPISSLRRARFGGVIASLVFTYSGYLTGFPVQQVTILAVSAWLPWVMWAVTAAVRPPTLDQQSANDKQDIKNNHASRLRAKPPFGTPHVSSPFWGALAFAMAILAGHPQTVLYIFYFSLAYTLFHAFYTWRNSSAKDQGSDITAEASITNYQLPGIKHHASRIIRLFIPWLIIVLLGTAIAAAQLLPTLEFIGYSLRADLSYQAVSAGLPLNEFIAILYPGFFGGSPEYVGIVSLVLIALALTMALTPKSPITNYRSPRKASKEIYFWAGAALVSLLLAFGGNTFFYPLFYLLVPGFETVRQQERAFLIYSFSAAVLAGYGAIVIAGPLSRYTRPIYILFERRLRQITSVALILTGFFIYGSAASTARGDEVNLFYGVLWHHLFGLMVLGGVLVLLILRGRRWLRRTWGMSLLALWLAFNLFTVNWRFNLEKPPEASFFRPNGVVRFLQEQSQQRLERIVSGGLLPGGNSAASIYHLQDLTGNTPLQLASVDTFMQQMPSWRAWQLLNVRHVVDTRNIADAGLKQVFEEDELRVFELGDPFPRTWFVSETEIIPDDGQAIARLAMDDFDLHRAAVVNEPFDAFLAEASASTVNIVEFEPTRLKAEINASGQHLLVFSQIYYPGWQAQIDGQPAELWRVNMIQQGVTVPSGNHIVELEFSPSTFWVGTIISVTAIVIWLTGLIWLAKKWATLEA